jgi:hypothetical protein
MLGARRHIEARIGQYWGRQSLLTLRDVPDTWTLSFGTTATATIKASTVFDGLPM